MDKRIEVGQEKYYKVHIELLEKGVDLLSNIQLTDASLNKLSEFVGVSKTTIYEHFNSSFQQFLSEVLTYSRDKLRNKYLEHFINDPLKNIVTVFDIWHEEIKKNKLFIANTYAVYILLKDTDLLPKPLMVNDLTEQLTLLGATDNEKKVFLNQFFYSSGKEAGVSNTELNQKVKDVESFLDSISNQFKE
jgi:AcrR family transcriptional regulator